MNSNLSKVYTVHFETLGCRLNQIESEGGASFFEKEGFSINMEPFTSKTSLKDDIVLSVINTCTVTSKAEQKARRLIRLLLKITPNACVLVTGCYAELDQKIISAISDKIFVLPGSKKSLLSEIPAILKVFLQKNIDFQSKKDFSFGSSFSKHLSFWLESKYVSISSELSSSSFSKVVDPFRLSTDTFFIHSRSSIKIQDGCNNACTYCRIHLARGKAVSLDVNTVLQRVQQLERKGYHEVVLTGVNLSQYKGAYNHTFLDLAQLLNLLLSSTTKICFRISSLYPERVDNDFCKVLINPRIQPHFHLSVQSGSDEILKKMCRPYNSKQVLEAVQRIRQVKPLAFIACDIIAGFPGETENDFNLTMELCQKAEFTWIHAFPFSPRPGTLAFTMKPTVPQSVTTQRIKKLTEFAIQSKCNYISLCSGKSVTAVTEFTRRDRAGNSKGMIHAVTANYLHVQLPGAFPQGSLIKVKICNALVENIKAGEDIEATAEAVIDEDNICSL